MTKLDQVLKIDHIDSDVEILEGRSIIHLKLKNDLMLVVSIIDDWNDVMFSVFRGTELLISNQTTIENLVSGINSYLEEC